MGFGFALGLEVGLDLVTLGLGLMVVLGEGRKRLVCFLFSEMSEGARKIGIKASSRAENLTTCFVFLP